MRMILIVMFFLVSACGASNQAVEKSDNSDLIKQLAAMKEELKQLRAATASAAAAKTGNGSPVSGMSLAQYRKIVVERFYKQDFVDHCENTGDGYCIKDVDDAVMRHKATAVCVFRGKLNMRPARETGVGSTYFLDLGKAASPRIQRVECVSGGNIYLPAVRENSKLQVLLVRTTQLPIDIGNGRTFMAPNAVVAKMKWNHSIPARDSFLRNNRNVYGFNY